MTNNTKKYYIQCTICEVMDHYGNYEEKILDDGYSIAVKIFKREGFIFKQMTCDQKDKFFFILCDELSYLFE